MNKRSFVLAALIVQSFLSAHAASSRPLEDLLHEAVRSSKTRERNEQKLAAKAELIERMPHSLRAAMEYAHGDNVMIQVLIMEWVTRLPSEMIVPTLLEFVDHERQETRRLAIFFLGFHQAPEYAEKIWPYLDDEKCRGAAIRTLGKWKVASARPVIEHWLSAGRERVRVVSANALRDIGDAAAIPALITALDDPVFTVRNTAARAVISFGEKAIPALEDIPDGISPRTREMCRRCLADLKAGSAGDLNDTGIHVDGSFFIP